MKPGGKLGMPNTMPTDHVSIVMQAQSLFVRMPDGTQRERDLIRVLGDTEMVMQMMANTRISVPAGSVNKKK
jgi:hypothetical protein